MWIERDDAKTDVILAGATAVFGLAFAAFVSSLPGYPRTGVAAVALGLAWTFALTGLVPYLLTRYRSLGAESYGLDAGRDGLTAGLLLAAPIVVAGVLRGLPSQGAVRALLGRVGAFLPGAGDGTAAGAASAVVEGSVQVVVVVILLAGTLLLYPFLTVRGRHAFRGDDVSVTEAVRTFGMAAAAAALVFGLLRSLRPDVTVVGVLVNVAALVAFVLLGDRLVPARATTPRPAVVTPVVVAVLIHLLPAFRGDALLGLYAGALAAGLVAVMASVIEGRTFAWAVVPPAVAMAVYPTCLTALNAAERSFGC